MNHLSPVHPAPALTPDHANGTASKGAMPRIDFLRPPGAAALYAPDSVSWQVFKNPVSLFIGGITAVLLELAEPRVRSGVWGHSIFPKAPLLRMQRTGLATSATIYAPAKAASALIGGVVRMHKKVRGDTPDGVAYHANDPALLDWVQATVSFGFMEAYAAFARPMTNAERDRFYAESKPSADLFGAVGAPLSLAEWHHQLEEMKPHLVSHPIIREFLEIVRDTPALPGALRPLQPMMLRAGISLLPDWLQARLDLGEAWKLKRREKLLLKILGRIAERVPVPNSPPVQASRRLGLPARYLYRGW